MWEFGGVKVIVEPGMQGERTIQSVELIPISASGSYIHYFGYGSRKISFRMLVAGELKRDQVEMIAASGGPVLLIGPLSNPVYSGLIYPMSIRWDAINVVCQTWDPEVPENITVVYRAVVEAVESD